METYDMVGIFYHPDGYSISGPNLMGRHAAGNSFLKGYLRHASPAKSLYIQIDNPKHAKDFKEFAEGFDRDETINFVTNSNLGTARESGTVYHPGPGIAEHAFNRSLYGDSEWSLCGITHTTSTARAMDAITSWITSPVQPWDAVICTSSAVKKNVEVVLQAQVDALKARLGITRMVLPKLPVIPLGINTKDFDYNSKERFEARTELAVTGEQLVVLYTGRLSFHAKAHPLAMYQALEAAARATEKDIVLIECGWHGNEHIENAFSVAAQLACPSIRVVTLDGREAHNRKLAWSSADVFCSLSDNIQETFGIVPIEAMAAGLPVVVTDWNGYKDSVRDGVDGFRIPTIAPAPGLAGDIAHRYALDIDTYDFYCGHSSSLVAVHAQKLVNAFVNLFQDPTLRKQMGEAGKTRAQKYYDWSAIIPEYEALWSELNDIRLASTPGEGETAPSTVWASRLDPTLSFANYPTQHLSAKTQFKLSQSSAAEALELLGEYKNLDMVNYAKYVFPTEDEMKDILLVAENSLPNWCTASTLISNVIQDRRPYVYRGLVWLCKLGLLHFK